MYKRCDPVYFVCGKEAQKVDTLRYTPAFEPVATEARHLHR